MHLMACEWDRLLLYLAAGNGKLSISGQECDLYAGEFILLETVSCLPVIFKGTASYKLICCSLKRGELPGLPSSGSPRQLGQHESVLLPHILSALQRETIMQAEGYAIMIEALLVQLTILLSRASRLDNRRNKNNAVDHHLLAEAINDYLEASYDKKIDLAAVSRLFNISKRQLNRIMKTALGTTALERVHQIRIQQAVHLLCETSGKMIEIANRVGYDDPAFFSQLFKRRMGCSPGKYRSMKLEMGSGSGLLGEKGNGKYQV